MASNGSTCNRSGCGQCSFHSQLFAHSPATTSGTLNDKHVVLIEMRADAAARYRKRSSDHQYASPVVHGTVASARRSAHASGLLPVPVMTSWFHRDDRAFERAVADLPFAILVMPTSRLSTSLSIARPANSSGEIGSIKLLKPRFNTTGRFCQ